MHIFIEAIDLNIWEAIEFDPFILTMVERNATIEKPREEEDDDFRFFVKRFNKFLRNKRNQRKSNINPKKKEEDSFLASKCYECDQPGHMRFNCLVFKRKMEKSDKRNFKEKKSYVTWEDNDINSSSDSENKIINLGLMLKDYESGEGQS